MAEFNPLKKDEKPEVAPVFNPLGVKRDTGKFSFAATQSGQERSDTLLAETANMTPDDVSRSRRDGTLTTVQQAALGNADKAQSVNAQTIIEESAVNNIPAEEAALRLTEEFNKVPFFQGLVDPAVTAFVLSSGNEASKRSVFKRLSKLEILYSVANQKLEVATDPWWRDFDFASTLISSVTPIYSTISANKRSELNARLNGLLDAEISEEEFAKQAADILDEAGDIYDYFGGKNRVNLEVFLSSVSEGPFGNTAKLDKAFGLVDIALLGTPSTLKAATAIGRAGVAGVTSAGVDIARLAGIVRRDPVLVKRILQTTAIKDDPTHSAAILANHTATSLATPNITRPRFQTAYSNTAVRDFEDADALFNVVRSIRGPEMVDEAAFKTVQDEILKAKTANGHRQVIDRSVDIDEFENIVYSEVYGTRSGGEFASKANATVLANKVDGLVAKTENGGFVVIKEENVSLIDPLKTGKGDNTIDGLVLFKTTDTDELGEGFWAKWGSPLAQTSDLNQALIVQNEATTAILSRQVESEIRPLVRTMKPSEIRNVNDMFEDLQNGVHSVRTQAWTVADFKSQYFQKFSKAPSDEEVAYYLKVQNFNDIDWRLKADIKFKDEVAKGTIVLRNLPDELNVRPASVDSVPDKDLIFDIDSNALIPKTSLQADSQVFSVASELAYKTPSGELVQYMTTRSPLTRRIQPEDVFSYNPGGPRRYWEQEAKFYLKQEREITLAGGRTAAETPITMMGVRTQEQALATKAQFDAIADAVDKSIGRVLSKNASVDDVNAWLKANPTNQNILTAIRNNSAFNVNISTIDDLVRFSEDTGVNLRKSIDWAGDGTPLTAGRNDYIPGVDTGMTYGASFRSVGLTKGARKNSPLLGYGGTELRRVPASDSIRKSVLSSVAKKSEAAYVASAVNGLIKGAIENKALLQDAKSSLSGLTLRGKLARLKDLIDTSTVQGRKLALERDKIEFRVNQRSPLDSAWDSFRFGVAESLYKKDGSKFRNWASDKFNQWSTSPVTAMRGWVFDAYLGMFAWDQLYVQSMQMVNVIGVADTGSAVVSAASYPINRFLLSNGDPNVIKAVADQVAPIMGLTSDQYVEMIQLLRGSGRTILDVSIAELGENASSSLIGSIREKGRFFFKEGELVSIIGAHQTAYMELVKQFPNIRPASQEGLRWIARRQNVLRQAMTFANRSPGQNLPFLQFLTYSWRMTEAMFAGSLGGGRTVLTAKEKLKLGTLHLAVFGTAAVPFAGYVADRIDQKYGIPIDNDTYNMLRWGMLDVALTEALGVETAFSSRVGIGEGITSTILNLMDGSIIEALAGPSGQFTGSTVSSTLNLIKDVRSGVGTGDYSVLKLDVSLLSRNIRSWGMAEQTYFAMMLGQYYNRTGTKVTGDVSTQEAVAIALGIPLKKFVEANSLTKTMFADKNYETKVVKRLNQLSVEAEKQTRLGDTETANSLRREIVTILNVHTGEQRERIFSGMAPEFFSQLDQTLLYAWRKELNTRNQESNMEEEE